MNLPDPTPVWIVGDDRGTAPWEVPATLPSDSREDSSGRHPDRLRPTGKISANTPRTFTVGGVGGVPSGALGVTGNVTVVNETAGWAVFLGPTANPAPTTSTINFAFGDVKGNGLTVALSGTGTLSATYISSAGNKTDLVFDVTGYFIK